LHLLVCLPTQMDARGIQPKNLVEDHGHL
jgi:hypothetical protein